jgi:hypothetical protein
MESFPATTTAYDSHLLTTSQPFPNIEPSWTTPYFSSPPQSSTWHVPQWLPSVEFASQLPASSSSAFDFSGPQAHQVFDHIMIPPGQSHEADNNLFILGSYGHVRRHMGDPPQISSVSVQSQSPYSQPEYLFQEP